MSSTQERGSSMKQVSVCLFSVSVFAFLSVVAYADDDAHYLWGFGVQIGWTEHGAYYGAPPSVLVESLESARAHAAKSQCIPIAPIDGLIQRMRAASDSRTLWPALESYRSNLATIIAQNCHCNCDQTPDSGPGTGRGGTAGGETKLPQRSPSGIKIEGATYGGNCGVPVGNASTHIAELCNGRTQCWYKVDSQLIGDDAYGCSKDYEVRYSCGNEPNITTKRIEAEAGTGNKTVLLTCDTNVDLPPDTPFRALPPPPGVASAAKIRIAHATYGGNCGVPKGNVTSQIADACNGATRCEYTVDSQVLGDPKYGCAKDYSVSFRCSSQGPLSTESIGAEAGTGNKKVTLVCAGGDADGTMSETYATSDAVSSIIVLEATYGGNCGVPRGNVTQHVAKQCDGNSQCRYVPNYKVIGDPAYNCKKDYILSYRCSGDGEVREERVAPEAGWGSKAVMLSCAARH